MKTGVKCCSEHFDNPLLSNVAFSINQFVYFSFLEVLMKTGAKSCIENTKGGTFLQTSGVQRDFLNLNFVCFSFRGVLMKTGAKSYTVNTQRPNILTNLGCRTWLSQFTILPTR